jgi:hypothetical protein
MKFTTSLRFAGSALGIALLVTMSGATAKPRLSAEEQLAKATEGRVAGEPVKCIRQQQIRSTQIIDRTAIVYRMTNGTVYVNRPESGAGFLTWDDILLTDTHSPSLCDVDFVELLDHNNRTTTGSVGLGVFVPYTKPSQKR